MDRVKTGISGLDGLMEGGLPKGSSTLLAGQCGTGKSIFALEFLYRGEEPGIFYTFEKNEDYLMRAASAFDWDIGKAVRERRISVVSSELYQFEGFLSDLRDNIDKLSAKRLVLDSLTIIGQFFDSPYKMRKALVGLRNMLAAEGCTALMISEIPETGRLSTYGVEEFVLDGVLLLDHTRHDSDILRSINIRKMLGTHHSTAYHPYEFTKKGIVVHRMREIK